MNAGEVLRDKRRKIGARSAGAATPDEPPARETDEVPEKGRQITDGRPG